MCVCSQSDTLILCSHRTIHGLDLAPLFFAEYTYSLLYPEWTIKKDLLYLSFCTLCIPGGGYTMNTPESEAVSYYKFNYQKVKRRLSHRYDIIYYSYTFFSVVICTHARYTPINALLDLIGSLYEKKYLYHLCIWIWLESLNKLNAIQSTL